MKNLDLVYKLVFMLGFAKDHAHEAWDMWMVERFDKREKEIIEKLQE